mmetsp:Transcript_1603/g.3644  ORF Transcript_1603/g.3644 Transcript_1603/m.3644 type:complete len:226 (+) Transcript_1603:110-787(+)
MTCGAVRRTFRSAWSMSWPPSTRPHSSIWKSSSTRAACMACSTVITPRISAMPVSRLLVLDAALNTAVSSHASRLISRLSAARITAGAWSAPKMLVVGASESPSSVRAQLMMGPCTRCWRSASGPGSARISVTSEGKYSSSLRTWNSRTSCSAIWSTAVMTSAMSGMVKGRMLRPLCHSHSAARASASALLGTARAVRLGVFSGRPSSVTPHPPPPGTSTTSTAL